MSETTLTQSAKSATILIVEDDPITREFLSHLLQRQYNILCADDGLAALDQIAQNKIDLVLLDMMMPRMNGLQLLEHLQKEKQIGAFPIILVTALANTSDIMRGMDLGASDFVAKPVDIGILLGRIRTQLEMKTLREERQKALEDLHSFNQMRDQLTRIVSHDLKSPLNNIRMAAHLLRERHTDTASRQIMQSMGETVDLMEAVINDFLDMIRIQADQVEITFNPVDLRSVIMGVLSQHELSFSSKSIRCVIGNTSGIAHADETYLSQVVSNLVSNALKFSKAGSSIHIWTEQHENEIRLSVRDQGPGVPHDERHLLFTEFSRISTQPTAGEGSTGLGLWIVKHLMDKLKGRSGADFPDEGGAVFWIALPVYEPETKSNPVISEASGF